MIQICECGCGYSYISHSILGMTNRLLLAIDTNVRQRHYKLLLLYICKINKSRKESVLFFFFNHILHILNGWLAYGSQVPTCIYMLYCSLYFIIIFIAKKIKFLIIHHNDK